MGTMHNICSCQKATITEKNINLSKKKHRNLIESYQKRRLLHQQKFISDFTPNATDEIDDARDLLNKVSIINKFTRGFLYRIYFLRIKRSELRREEKSLISNCNEKIKEVFQLISTKRSNSLKNKIMNTYYGIDLLKQDPFYNNLLLDFRKSDFNKKQNNKIFSNNYKIKYSLEKLEIAEIYYGDLDLSYQKHGIGILISFTFNVILFSSWINDSINPRSSFRSKLITLDGDEYIGYINSTFKLNGFYEIRYKSLNTIFKGIIVNGNKEGKGEERTPFYVFKGTYINNSFQKGKITYFHSQIQYEGFFNVQNKFHKTGTIIYKNGDIYTGGFKDGLYDGYGTYKWISKNIIFKGEYKQGFRDGKGIMKLPNGIIAGNFVNGLLEGRAWVSIYNKYDGVVEFVKGKMISGPNENLMKLIDWQIEEENFDV